uniref:Decapping nuclease n=1 Tax=Trichuris muris TaxID=70415 RepID=A0A5S6QG31_TRIMR
MVYSRTFDGAVIFRCVKDTTMESELKVHLSPAVLSFLLYDACNSVAEFEGILYGSVSTRSSMLCSDAVSSDQTVLTTCDVNIERFVNCGCSHSFYDRQLKLHTDFIEKLGAKVLDERPNYGPLGWFRFRRQSMLPNRSRLEHVISRQLCYIESLTENFCREGVLFFLITEEPLAPGEQKNCGEVSYQLFRYWMWGVFAKKSILWLQGSTKAVTQCYVNELNAKREQVTKSADFTAACSNVSKSSIRDGIRKSLLYNYCPLDLQMGNEAVSWLLDPKLLSQTASVSEASTSNDVSTENSSAIESELTVC